LSVRYYDRDNSVSTAGDKMSRSNGQQFSTKDQDNDQTTSKHCAAEEDQGGFWHYRCENNDKDKNRITASGNKFKWGSNTLSSAKMLVMCPTND